jgi:biotin carboxylase
MPRVLLLLPTTTYRTSDFLEASRRLRVDVTVASEQSSTLENLNPESLLTLDFCDLQGCAQRVREFAEKVPLDAVVGVDEETAVAAAVIAEALSLPHNPVPATAAARDKGMMRRLLVKAGVPSPPHRVVHRSEDPRRVAAEVRFPCVLKPTFLAGSRGVIRADDSERFVSAWQRIERILNEPEVARRGGELAEEILVEDFVPGFEVAIEGLLRQGRLRVLALFDKPDPLEGPFFEETIYVTPSRLPVETQRLVEQVTRRGAAALGLRDGPVHAELRVGPHGIWLIEIAARSIGGLCSRTLRFAMAMSLEELILRHALAMDTPEPERDRQAAGVLMIPIPRAGVLKGVTGLEGARAVSDIEDVRVSAHLGQTLVPLPEGSRYLGFLFSRAETPERAEAALREAHALLNFQIV